MPVPVHAGGSGPLAAPSPFACAARRGVISAGRQFEMVFEYTPQEDTPAEAFWVFRIPEQNIVVPFLLVRRDGGE